MYITREHQNTHTKTAEINESTIRDFNTTHSVTNRMNRGKNE